MLEQTENNHEVISFIIMVFADLLKIFIEISVIIGLFFQIYIVLIDLKVNSVNHGPAVSLNLWTWTISELGKHEFSSHWCSLSI